MDCAENGIEWNVLAMQCSMQEFGEDDPQSLSATVRTHSLTVFPACDESSDESELPPDSSLNSVPAAPIPVLNPAKSEAVPQSAFVPRLSVGEVRVLSWVSSHAYYLHLMVFRGDVQMLRQFLAMEPRGLQRIINEKDHRGNTPLMLAVKLSHLSACYFTIARVLLGRGADPKKKDAEGWSPLDEATAKADRDLVGLIFDHLCREKTKQWETAKHKAIAALQRLPDFYVEIKWEFDSAVIPLLKKLAPHDVCKIWKCGSSIRLDMTLVGWKKLRSKRRNVSLLFNPSSELSYRDFQLVNHSKRLVVYPLEPLDAQEREAVLTDILKADAIKGEVSLSRCTVIPAHSWSGKVIAGTVGQWHCRKLDIQLQAVLNYTKRGSAIQQLQEREYFSQMVGRATRPSSLSLPDVALETPRQKEDYGEVKSARKGRLFVWVSKEFPITLRDFLPVLEMLAPGNSTLQKMYELLTSPAFAEHFSADMFPVKLEIPLTLTIKAQATFLKVELGTVDAAVLKPPDYPIESRRVAQKTLTCPKKRLFFANIAA